MGSALILAAAMLAMVVFGQLGRRHFGLHSILLPFGVVGFVCVQYLHGIPTNAQSLVMVAVGVLIGVVAGLASLAAIKVERDDRGRAYTRAGLAYLGVWAVTLATRLGFIYATEHSPSFARAVGTFSMEHHLNAQSWIAFFVLMALSMVVVRSVGVAIRLRALHPATHGNYSIAA